MDNIFIGERVKDSSTAWLENSFMQILGVIFTQRGLTIHFLNSKMWTIFKLKRLFKQGNKKRPVLTHLTSKKEEIRRTANCDPTYFLENDKKLA